MCGMKQGWVKNEYLGAQMNKPEIRKKMYEEYLEKYSSKLFLDISFLNSLKKDDWRLTALNFQILERREDIEIYELFLNADITAFRDFIEEKYKKERWEKVKRLLLVYQPPDLRNENTRKISAPAFDETEIKKYEDSLKTYISRYDDLYNRLPHNYQHLLVQLRQTNGEHRIRTMFESEHDKRNMRIFKEAFLSFDVDKMLEVANHKEEIIQEEKIETKTKFPFHLIPLAISVAFLLWLLILLISNGS